MTAASRELEISDVNREFVREVRELGCNCKFTVSADYTAMYHDNNCRIWPRLKERERRDKESNGNESA